MDLTPETLRMIVVGLITLILSITVHEFGHAIVADKLGDRLPRYEGRVTLNPIAHADPIGTLALPLLLGLTSGGMIGFGWGRPVRVNPGAFSRRFSMRTGHMMVAAAGPAMNLLFGLVISMVLFTLVKTGTLSPLDQTQRDIMVAINYAVLLNFILLFFNMVPMAPLDGGTVLLGFLPYRAARAYENVARYGWAIVLAVAFTPLRIVFVWPAKQLYLFWVGSVLGLPTLHV
jgi:Zn-dependent protease